jgi:hypothetical protein
MCLRMKISIHYDQKQMLPLVEGFMVDYHPRIVWWYLFFSCGNLPFPVSTSSPLHGWPPYCGCGLLHALERVFVFNPVPQETEHSPHSLHFVYVPHFPSTTFLIAPSVFSNVYSLTCSRNVLHLKQINK